MATPHTGGAPTGGPPHPDQAAGPQTATTSPTAATASTAATTADDDVSVGQLVNEIAGDLSRLLHEEVELAKAEIKEQTTRAGKGAGMLGGAGYAGHLTLLLGSLAVVFAFRHVMDLAWAALLVTAVWAIVGAVLYVTGRKRLRTVQLKPEKSIDSLKEDAKWARHPTS
jgi:hypothetical protein